MRIPRRIVLTLGVLWSRFSLADESLMLMRVKPTSSWPRARMRTPKWTNGVLISVQNHDTINPLIWVADGAGQRTIPFSVSGASALRVEDWDQNRSGSVGLSGYAADAEGRVSGFVAFIFPNGESRVVQTSLYRPVRMAVGPDGTIWAAGSEVGVSAAGKPLKTLLSSAPIIRRFDKVGNLIGSYIPQSTIGEARYLSSSNHAIAASLNRVTWYTLGGRLVEISTNGDSISDNLVAAPVEEESLLMSGFGSTNSGDVYLATYRVKKGSGSEPEAFDEKFKLNRRTNRWELLRPSLSDKGDIESGRLGGVEDDALVILSPNSVRMYRSGK